MIERVCHYGMIVLVIHMTLLEIRKQFNLSQERAAKELAIPLRTYIRYERDNSYGNSLKREMMIRILIEKHEITEDKGLLTIDFIKKSLNELFSKQYKEQVDFCYLFGSYAKGYASETSDVDLCIATSLTGLRFVGLSERIRNVLHKKIDLIRLSNLENNLSLITDIMESGIRIYGQQEK